MGLIVEEIGEPSNKEVEIDIDPCMLEVVKRASSAEDTSFILVDPHDPYKVLKISSNLGS